MQVATSLIQELAHYDDCPFQILVAASSEVDTNLKGVGVDLSRLGLYQVIDCFGFRLSLPKLEEMVASADLTFTVFGPLYLARKPKISVVGFAQPWIIYPDNEAKQRLNWKKRLLTSIRFDLHKYFYHRNSDFVFVEADHVKRQLARLTNFSEDVISVIPNCASDVFLKAAPTSIIPTARSKGKLKIGFLGRNYEHKNLVVLPEVQALLRSSFNLEVEFFVTLNDSEWKSCSPEFRRNVVNLGSLQLSECPDFYDKMDAIIFPSLLECFSATPLESMIMKKPLLASDRAFVRDFCGEFPFYFDPCDPADIARSVAHFSQQPRDAIEERTKLAQAYVLSHYSPRKRARTYISRLISVFAATQTRLG